MIDTHTHLYMTDTFPDGGVSAVQKAIEAGVSRLVLPGVSLASVDAQLTLHNQFPENTFVAPGLHPTEAGENWKEEVEEIFTRFSSYKPVAVGEVGVDLYWDKTHCHRQMDAFGYQLEKAREMNLPVIIHSREALDETLEVARGFGNECPRLLFHSFTASPHEAGKILDTFDDALFGFNGVITFKNAAEVREAAKMVGIDRIVSETDAPYLSPVPFRGTTNDSSRIPVIIKAIADTCGVSETEAREKLSANASEFFGI